MFDHMVRSGVLACTLLVASALAVNAEDVGPDAARQLLSEGRIRPLSEILAAAKSKVPGEMIAVELEKEDDRYVYGLKILRSDGHVQEVEVDAATGSILKLEDDD